MVAFTEDICDRGTRIQGTKGELIGDMKDFVSVLPCSFALLITSSPHSRMIRHSSRFSVYLLRMT